jgi:predicted Ser/Thr protein kinase
MSGPPETIGDYVIGECIGRGSFGAVFHARHSVIDRHVAIKILHPHRCVDPAAVARFVTEARAANHIHHPGIVEIYDFGELADGRAYCIMELLRGKTLRAVLDECGHLPARDALPLLHALAEAIDAAHAAGIAHRDLKPENVMILDDGSVRLIDFGSAKLVADAPITQTGAVLGTPRYMAPERCRGQGGDVRADLYSFGALAYHVLAGVPPFSGDPLALALQHVNDTPALPSSHVAELTPAVDDVVMRLLDKQPGRRPRPLAAAVDQMTAPRSRTVRRALIAGSALALCLGVTRYVWVQEPTPTAKVPVVYIAALQPLRLGVDDAVAPVIANDGEVTYSDGKSLWSTRHGLAVQIDATATYRSRLEDGRWLISRDVAGIGPSIWLEDGHSAPRMLTTGMWASAAPHGTKAIVQRGGPTIIDVGSADTTALNSDSGLYRWSTDGTRMVVCGAGGVWLLDHGAGVQIDLGDVDASHTVAAVTFLGNDTLMYCRRNDGVWLRHLDGQPDERLLTMPPNTRSCEVATSPNGRRAIVIAQHDGPTPSEGFLVDLVRLPVLAD